MTELLYQKIGAAVDGIAQDLLTRKQGDRIPSVSEYEEMLGVSRGTVQNSFAYLKEHGAAEFVSRGKLGTYLKEVDYQRLQACTQWKELLGVMPLPYSVRYQGLATALYAALAPFSFNLVYARGAGSRLRLLTSGACQFILCSRLAAQAAVSAGTPAQMVLDFGPGTYLSSHVLVLHDPAATGICSGMRVACDSASIDHEHITRRVCAGVPGVEFVDMRAHHALTAVLDGTVDAGIWNLDDILETGHTGLNLRPLDTMLDMAPYTSAVVMARRGADALVRLLQRHLDPAAVREIQAEVCSGARTVNY